MQEKQQAQTTYDQALQRGDGAQLLEQKRADIFELVRRPARCVWLHTRGGSTDLILSLIGLLSECRESFTWTASINFDHVRTVV